MSRAGIALVCVCAAACSFASWRSSPAAPPADENGERVEKAKPAQMPVVAIIPPIGRGDPSYVTLSPAVTSMLGSILEQSGRAIVVDRTSIGKVFSEKDLAEFSLSDRETLARKGQLIGANHVISGHYDVRDDKVRLEINRVEIADWLHRTGALGEYSFTQLPCECSSDQLIEVVEEMARRVLKKLPEAPPSPPGDSSLAKGKAVAVFSLAVCPRDERTEGAAGLLADVLATDIQQSLLVRLVEREKLEHVLAERKLQFAGLAARGQAVLAARLLGADYLLTGSVVHAGKRLRVDVQLLDVATGAVVATASAKTTAEKLLETHQELAQALSRRVGPGLERLARLAPSPADWRTAEAEIQAHWAENFIRSSTERDAPFIARVRGLIRVALDLAPDNGLVNKSAGEVAARLGDRDAARRYFRKGAERGSDVPECHISYARFLLHFREDSDKALKHARRAVELLELKPETLLETSLCARQTIAVALLVTGQLEEAEKWAMVTAARDSSEKTVQTAIAILEAQGRYREAADLLARKGGDAAQIAKLLRRAGQAPDKRKQLALLIRRNGLYTNRRLQLARDSIKSNPELAAAICRRIIQHLGWTKEKPRPPSNPSAGYSKRDYYPGHGVVYHPKVNDAQAAEARAILKEMGQTPETPLVTGPVFDIEALRKRGVKYALLKYEKFPYEEQLPYLAAYLEDVFGVPIALNENPRKAPKDAFDEIQGLIVQSDVIDWDMIHGQLQLKCVGVTGLMGFPILSVNKKRLDLPLFSTPRSMVCTTGCAGRTPPTHAARTFIVGNLLRNLSCCVATRIRPLRVIRAMTPSCPAQACIVTMWGVRDCEMVPCPVCRKELYEIRKDWEKGPPQRDPIVAGPAEPVLAEPALADGKQAAEVLLVPMDISAEDAHLDQLAQALSASLGLRCKIHARIDRGDNIPAVPKSLAEISPELDGVDKRFAAVCVLTGKRFCEKPWDEMLIGEAVFLSLRRWRVWIPGLDEPGPKTACPLIVLSVAAQRDFNLPYCYRRLETFSVEKDGRKVVIQAPAYSKLLIGALAIAAREDHECWTLGCPTTVWETIGIPHRCSHYLCPECRKAVAAYYGSRRKEER